jgi:hypothetical protein
MTATLFQTGNDLSEDFMKDCVRRMKTSSFDLYTMIENPKVSIKHHARRKSPEFVGYTKDGGSRFVVGESFDSFDVWVQLQDADSVAGIPGCSKCVAEDVRSFDVAIAIAKEFV